MFRSTTNGNYTFRVRRLYKGRKIEEFRLSKIEPLVPHLSSEGLFFDAEILGITSHIITAYMAKSHGVGWVVDVLVVDKLKLL